MQASLRELVVIMVNNEFWNIDLDTIEHQESANPINGERLFAYFFILPIFLFTAVIVPILYISLSIDDPKKLVGGLFLGIPYALAPFTLYHMYLGLLSDYSVHINTADNTIEAKTSYKNKEFVEKYPLDEIKWVKVVDPFDDEVANNYIKIIGKNSQGVKWSLDITPFAKELYSQGKPSSDRRRIAAIKTAERYAELLGVEVASWVKLQYPKLELREEFGIDWIHHWSMGDELKERTRRVINENPVDKISS